MRKRVRRRHAPAVDLEVTSFINLMVVLVTFFLGSAVFFQNSVLNLNIPSSVTGAAEPSKVLQLVVVIRKDSLEVADRNGGMIQRIANRDGRHDFRGLNEVLKMVKSRFPEKQDAAILSEPDTPYQVLVKTMDATRTYAVVYPNRVAHAELFPNISMGAAPSTQVSGVQQ